MRIQVRAGLGAGSILHDAAERRLRFALGRFERRIASVSVRFNDLNGPRGGIDKVCRLAVRLGSPSGLIVVEDVDADPLAALGRAVDRAARAVTRAIEQARQGRPALSWMEEAVS